VALTLEEFLFIFLVFKHKIFFQAHNDTSSDKRASMHSAIVWFSPETVNQAAHYWSPKQTVPHLRIAPTSIQSTSLVGAGMSSIPIRNNFCWHTPGW